MSIGLKLSRYHAATEVFQDERDGSRKHLVFAARTGQMLEIDVHTWLRLQADQVKDLDVDRRQVLVDAELLVPEGEDELDTILRQNDEAAASEKTLYIVIQATAYCQLGCSYCGQRHYRKRLSHEDQDRLVARIDRKLASGRYEQLRVAWYGGEPLVGLPVIRSLTPRLVALAAKHGCSYTAKTATNGLALSPKVATELVQQHHIRSIEITLDGSARTHDVSRRTKNGRPTFDTIFRNVVRFARRDDLDAKLSIRCNATRENRDEVLPLVRMLAEAGIHDRISRFYVAPVYNWGDNQAGYENAPCEEFGRWEIEWYAEMMRLGFHVTLLPKRKKTPCMAVCPDSEAVDPNGVLFNCAEVSLISGYERPELASDLPILDDHTACARTNIYAVGNLTEGSDPAQRLHFGNLTDRIRCGNGVNCNNCRMLPACGGSCPKKWLDGTPPCPPEKFNIEQRMLLTYAQTRLAKPNLFSEQ